MNDENKMEYIEFSPTDFSQATVPKLSESDRRLLARSGIRGTEVYGESLNHESREKARAALAMAMTGVGRAARLDG
jgi:hypothetical protein